MTFTTRARSFERALALLAATVLTAAFGLASLEADGQARRNDRRALPPDATACRSVVQRVPSSSQPASIPGRCEPDPVLRRLDFGGALHG